MSEIVKYDSSDPMLYEIVMKDRERIRNVDTVIDQQLRTLQSHILDNYSTPESNRRCIKLYPEVIRNSVPTLLDKFANLFVMSLPASLHPYLDYRFPSLEKVGHTVPILARSARMKISRVPVTCSDDEFIDAMTKSLLDFYNTMIEDNKTQVEQPITYYLYVPIAGDVFSGNAPVDPETGNAFVGPITRYTYRCDPCPIF